MAKTNTAKTGTVLPPLPQSVDEQQEYLKNAAPSEQIAEEEDVSHLALTDPALLAQLSKVSKAKDADFATQEDFWNPGEGEFRQGVFIGSSKRPGMTYYQHAMLVTGEDGKPNVIVFNGSMSLTKKLKKFEKGTSIRVTYVGQVISQTSGNKVNTWEVATLK